MKQTASIISTYTSDTMGVASALFELGGMTVMHDASGCNSTYNTHDEPRWYDFDSMVFISGLTETEAIMGDDNKLIDDIVSAANDLSPSFIAIAGTPVPMMIGTDFDAIANVVEKKTNIPTFGFDTNGMNSYIKGADSAFLKLSKRMLNENVKKETDLSVNILGLTPLDFSVNSTVSSIKNLLIKNGIKITSSWAMGSLLSEIENSLSANVNLVVSQCGMSAAKYMSEKYNIPYVVGTPTGEKFSQKVIDDIIAAFKTKKSIISFSDRNISPPKIAVIGESVNSFSLAKAIELEIGESVKTVCPLELEDGFVENKDSAATDEDDIEAAIKDIKTVIADPLYKPICRGAESFISLPHEAFSGRIFRNSIPDSVSDFKNIIKEVMKNEKRKKNYLYSTLLCASFVCSRMRRKKRGDRHRTRNDNCC